MSFARFQLDVRNLQRDLDAMGNRAPMVMARAVNRAAIAGKTAMVKGVSEDIGLRQKEIERNLKIDKATRISPTVAIEITGARIPLIGFGARGPEPSRGRGRGVSYRIGSVRGRISNAFIATMPSGHRGVFKRTSKKRLPIQELRGPSLPKVFEKHLDVFGRVAQEALTKNLRHEIDWARASESVTAA